MVSKESGLTLIRVGMLHISEPDLVTECVAGHVT